MPPSGRLQPPVVRAFPKLYNAHQRVERSRGLRPEHLGYFRKNPLSDIWKTQVSQDVVDFIDKMEEREYVKDEKFVLTDEMLPQEKAKLFENPAQYFSRPHNVPEKMRKQVYLPNFSLILLRTPHLGPRYAQFQVPLWFSKLDLKSYLKNLYDVEVNHIRSFVVYKAPTRKESPTRYTQGQQIRQPFEKKMTVELIKPFIWPVELTKSERNNDDYGKQRYWDSVQNAAEFQQKSQAEYVSEPNERHRRSIAQQAEELLAGKATWKPTWQEIPTDVKVLQGRRKASAASTVPISLSRGSSSPPQ